MHDLPISHVRILTQQDEQKNRLADWADAVITANTRLRAITDTFRELELLEEQLTGHGYHLKADLGPVGDAARAAYQTLSGETGRTFEMPKSA